MLCLHHYSLVINWRMKKTSLTGRLFTSILRLEHSQSRYDYHDENFDDECGSAKRNVSHILSDIGTRRALIEFSR